VRLHWPVLTVCLLCALPLVASAAEFYTPPVISVPRVETVPTIDGQLGAEEWSGAAVFSSLVSLGGNEQPSLPTTVYAVYDAAGLYIGAQMHDPHPQELRATVQQRDGKVWEDDCLELFIDTVGQRHSYAHLVVNPLGTQYDAVQEDASEDFRWEAQTAVVDTGWTAEIALPFANNVSPRPGDTWIMNVTRHAVGAAEFSSWARVKESFHEPENFGTLIFGVRPFRVTLDDPGALWLGDNVAWLSVKPLTKTEEESQQWDIKLNVRVMGRDKAGHYFGSVKQSLGSEVTQVAVPYTVKQDGLSTVTFSLTDSEGVVRWRSGPYPVPAPPVSVALQEGETALGEALLAWAQLPAGEEKQVYDQQLNDLLAGWDYLDQRYQHREEMTPAELEALLAQVEFISQQAHLAHEQMIQSRE